MKYSSSVIFILIDVMGQLERMGNKRRAVDWLNQAKHGFEWPLDVAARGFFSQQAVVRKAEVES